MVDRLDNIELEAARTGLSTMNHVGPFFNGRWGQVVNGTLDLFKAMEGSAINPSQDYLTLPQGRHSLPVHFDLKARRRLTDHKLFVGLFLCAEAI